MASKHLVLVGGGHAHLTAITGIGDLVRRGHRVTLIGPSPHHYYSGMGPGMLGGFYRPEEIRFPIRRMVEERGGVFLEDRVAAVDAAARILQLASGGTVGYDAVSFNVGSTIPSQIASPGDERVLTVKPIDNLLKGRQAILEMVAEKHPRIVVVGGGPAGLELTGNIWRLVDRSGGRAHILLLAGSKLLGHAHPDVRKIALRSLDRRGLELIEGSLVTLARDGAATLEDGRMFEYDLCFLAVGVRPPEIFAASGLSVGGDGGLMVNEYLQSPDHPEMFGGGDCIFFGPRPLDKVGVYATRQNAVLLHNLTAFLEGERLEPFRPQDTYLLVFNLGDGTGIYWRGSSVRNGRAAFWLKNWIDRRFMRTFLPRD